MNQAHCLLTLALPATLQEDLLDFLQQHPETVSGFTVIHAEGFGAGSRLRSTLEQVRGRSQRVLVQIALTDAACQPLVLALGAQFPSDEIAWWTSPLSDFGRLA